MLKTITKKTNVTKLVIILLITLHTITANAVDSNSKNNQDKDAGNLKQEQKSGSKKKSGEQKFIALKKITALIEKKDYKNAFEYSKSLEKKYAGDPSFDFIHGTSAYLAGDASAAIFSFSRALILNPNNHDVHFALAKTYYSTGKYKNAEHEFKLLKNYNLTNDMDFQVSKYLSEIAKNNKTALHKLYLISSVGYDTNVGNQSDITDFTFFDTDGTNPISSTLDASEQSKGDTFLYNKIGKIYFKNLTKSSNLYFAGSLTDKSYFTERARNDTDINLYASIKLKFQNISFRVPVRYSRSYLEFISYNDNSSIGFQYKHILPIIKSDFSSFIQVGSSEYHTSSNLDNKNVLIGTTFSKKIPIIKLIGTFSLTHNNITSNKIPTNNKESIFITLGVRKFFNKNKFALKAVYGRYKYKVFNITFLKSRRDTTSIVDLGWERDITENLQFMANAKYTKSDSNISLYGYKKYLFDVGFKYSF